MIDQIPLESFQMAEELYLDQKTVTNPKFELWQKSGSFIEKPQNNSIHMIENMDNSLGSENIVPGLLNKTVVKRSDLFIEIDEYSPENTQHIFGPDRAAVSFRSRASMVSILNDVEH